MKNLNLMEFFAEFKEQKNIDRPTLMKILEEVLQNALKREYGTSDNFDIIINPDKNDFEIWHNRVVVADEEFTDPVTQIPLSEARKIDEDYELEEEVTEAVNINNLNRRTILAMRQNLQSKVLEYEKSNVFNKYKEKIGEIITGEVYQVWKKEILLLDDEGNELILPRSEQIPTDFYHKGDVVRGVLIKVEMKNNTPYIIVSRTSPVFLERLFEQEVPEIFDGLITIKKIVRIPGERAKVAVESYDERIDPVGACVGVKGSRIHGIVRELRNENIDVINYTNNTALYIQRALSPAKVSEIKLTEKDGKKRAEVYLDPDQVSLAIGKGGFNIKLASQLTGYEIDVFRNLVEGEEEDIDLTEFTDEIDEWVIEELNKIGCDTAKSVLKYTPEELARLTDLEEETILNVFNIIKEEFES
ncbi:MAG: transcription termination factor NusA [Bacteroidales bacterium]|jgi:N utilization substance protein A|nr:transcription termination/antitermination protein NusA [Bacteroidales bacterium]HNV95295.1 transcription termination factor NusA [Bacteroidales bacterium]HOU97698.1 transcription termination factor NusA [Bacteroidales bacterium]